MQTTSMSIRRFAYDYTSARQGVSFNEDPAVHTIETQQRLYTIHGLYVAYGDYRHRPDS